MRTDRGGGVRYVQNLTNSLLDSVSEMVFLGVGGKAETRGKIRYIPVAQSANSTWRFLLGLIWARIWYLRDVSAVIHVHRLYYCLPFLGRRFCCIVTLHGRTFTVFPKRFGRLASRIVFPIFRNIEGFLLKRATKIVAVSSDVVDQFKQRHGNLIDQSDISIIPSMIDLQSFSPDRPPWPDSPYPDSDVCLFVGRIAHVKNLPLLLRTWELVLAELPEAKLVIAGEGEDANLISKQIENSALVRAVCMAGAVPPDIVPLAISSAKVLVLTSQHEASPTVVKEALACGIPVVSTPVGDVASIISDGETGAIVEPDEKALAAAIVAVMGWNRSRHRIAEHAHLKLKPFEPSEVTKKYLTLYRALGA
ncbi:glycosyltransferase [Erythrobacter vulgaris]|uniref:Glycosyltransferase n=1 Tax=Qipengyuania vulgaris TaxID=291985 RepID=A0A844XMU9_9SPHN|nr:glycosyltransferase family 4 protein [Qipengyuania vulgaris]MXO47495.1 glycosyltransferase [Qipengyuania vulgaris]